MFTKLDNKPYLYKDNLKRITNRAKSQLEHDAPYGLPFKQNSMKDDTLKQETIQWDAVIDPLIIEYVANHIGGSWKALSQELLLEGTTFQQI